MAAVAALHGAGLQTFSPTIHVRIVDAHNGEVLSTTSRGPYMLVKLRASAATRHAAYRPRPAEGPDCSGEGHGESGVLLEHPVPRLTGYPHGRRAIVRTLTG